MNLSSPTLPTSPPRYSLVVIGAGTDDAYGDTDDDALCMYITMCQCRKRVLVTKTLVVSLRLDHLYHFLQRPSPAKRRLRIRVNRFRWRMDQDQICRGLNFQALALFRKRKLMLIFHHLYCIERRSGA